MEKVKSRDGTLIAYERTGPKGETPLILVDGAFCSRNFGPMPKISTHIAPHMDVIWYDRRARGDSTDTKPYSIEREIEDLQTLIETVGGRAHLLGISSGAVLCLYACAAGLPIEKISIYEAPFLVGKHKKTVPNHTSHLSALISQEKRSAAVKYYMSQVIGIPAIVPFMMQFLPMWKQMKAIAPSLVYDAAIMGDFSLPDTMLQKVNTKTLVMYGEKTMELLADAAKEIANKLENAQLISLTGQTHNVKAEIIAPALLEFFAAQKPQGTKQPQSAG